jgi:hypothetical protein
VSLDTLLSILFLLVFIVLPLLSRAMRKSSQQRPGAPPRPPQGNMPDFGEADAPPWLAEAQRRVREARGEGPAEASTSAPGGRPLVSGDPFTELEPSQRGRQMVPEDPQGRAFAPPGGPLVQADAADRPYVPPADGKLVPEDPFGGGLMGTGSQPGQAGAGPQAAQGGGQAAARPAAAQPPARPAVPVPAERREYEVAVVAVEAGGKGSAERAWTATPAHMRRRRGRGGARLRAMGVQRFSGRDVVSGLIWHEILDEPAWKRRQRRASSRPRSR